VRTRCLFSCGEEGRLGGGVVSRGGCVGFGCRGCGLRGSRGAGQSRGIDPS
jgi:hypothetical protein